MTQQSRNALKGYFETGQIPTQEQFHALIDSIGGFASVADMLADTSTFAEGEVIRALGYCYQVAAFGARDHHLTTAGGTKLYVMPGADGKRSVDAFGAVGDGIADDSRALSTALSTGGSLALTGGKVYQGGGNYYRITAGFVLDGNGAELRDWPVVGDGAGLSGIHFSNVRFTTRNPSGANAVIGTNFENVDRVSYDKCVFENTALYAQCSDGNMHRGLTITGCTFNVDWTNVTYLQKDIVTVRGYHGVNIHGNTIKARNIHRVFKCSSSLANPDYSTVPDENTKGLFVTNNAIDVLCDADPSPGKQLMDTFFGTTQFVFANNHVKAYGLTAGIEGKTAAPYTASNVATSQKIINNYFEMDAPSVSFQGSFGMVAAIQNSYDNLLVQGNTFRQVATADNTVAARYFNALTITGNHFISDTSVVDKKHMYLTSNDNTVVSGNTIFNGTTHIDRTTSNSGGQTFNSEPRIVTISGNSVDGYTRDGAFFIKNCVNLEMVGITGNTMTTLVDNTSIYGALWIHSSACGKLVVANNIASNPANSTQEQFRVVNTPIMDLVQAGNSWQ